MGSWIPPHTVVFSCLVFVYFNHSLLPSLPGCLFLGPFTKLVLEMLLSSLVSQACRFLKHMHKAEAAGQKIPEDLPPHCSLPSQSLTTF